MLPSGGLKHVFFYSLNLSKTFTEQFPVRVFLRFIPSAVCPHSVPQPRSCSNTSSFPNTARRRPTSASWLTGTGGGRRRDTATAALTTQTGDSHTSAGERFVAKTVSWINSARVCFFSCEVNPVIKRTTTLLSGRSPRSVRRSLKAGRFSTERSVCLTLLSSFIYQTSYI